jgi:hypothetical protein
MTPSRVGIPFPSVIADDASRPVVYARFDELRVYQVAGIMRRVTGVPLRTIGLIGGHDNFVDVANGELLVGCGDSAKLDRRTALRIIESLAYGFLDYAARESVCGRGIYGPPIISGRRPQGHRAMSVTERVRKHRNIALSKAA